MSAAASSSSAGSKSKHAASLSTHAVATETPLPPEDDAAEDGQQAVEDGVVEEQEGPQPSTSASAGNGNGNGSQDVNGQMRDPVLEDDNQGSADRDAHDGEQDSGTRIANLEADLDRVTDEKNKLESQYRNLLGKLTNMRNTLGDKLRQDAEELDRREQQIIDLQASNEDLQETVETLKSELIANNEECERLHTQVEQLRLRADDSAKASLDESSARETQLREVVEDLEKCRLEREDWENQAMKERVERETLETSLNSAERELAQLRHEKQVLKDERDREAESAANLHNVLEEFQAAKDKELRATLGDLQAQLQSTSRSMQEYKQKAQTAEMKLAESHSDSERCITLQKEVKEKNIFIGKLRHEAVILNEHLTEALRRLKKDTSENNVDRRLVTNVLITFFNTPRADSKRFEMLSVLASILSWGDDDRERAGLQRIGAGGGSANGAGPSSKPNISLGSSRRRAMSRATSAFTGRGGPPPPSDESFSGADGLEQSFSNLWVEYLLREAQGGSPPVETASSAYPPPLPSSSSFTSPTLGSASRTISPFAELARPSSPTKSSASTSTAGRHTAAPLSRQRSGTETSESVFSRTGDASSTAPTSIASGS